MFKVEIENVFHLFVIIKPSKRVKKAAKFLKLECYVKYTLSHRTHLQNKDKKLILCHKQWFKILTVK